MSARVSLARGGVSARTRVALAWGAGVAAFCLLEFGLAQLFAAEENFQVEWALRLPKERERARKAGFTDAVPAPPRFDPATDAGVDWILLDAKMRANSPDGKLDQYNILWGYANPRTRRKVKRSEVLALLTKYRPFMPDADRASWKVNCHLPPRASHDGWEGFHACNLSAAMYLARAVEARDRGDMNGAVSDLTTAVRTARQLQSQSTFSGNGNGMSIELLALRILRESPQAKNSLMRFGNQGPMMFLLSPPPDEPSASSRLRAILRDDWSQIHAELHRRRSEKYERDKINVIGSIPILSLLNRLDFVLGHRVNNDSQEALNAWVMAGVASRLRNHPDRSRPYTIWKITESWDAHVERQMEGHPQWMEPTQWENVPLTRLMRDTDRALTTAVWNQVNGRHTPVPDDPFAGKPHVPLRRRDLPDGATIWYSVGEDGKDDGGDWMKDRTARVPPPMKK